MSDSASTQPPSPEPQLPCPAPLPPCRDKELPVSNARYPTLPSLPQKLNGTVPNPDAFPRSEESGQPQAPSPPSNVDPAMEYFKNTFSVSNAGMDEAQFLQSLRPDPEISIFTPTGYAPAYTSLPAPLQQTQQTPFVKQEDQLCDPMQPPMPPVSMQPPLVPVPMLPPGAMLPLDATPEVFVRTAYGYIPCSSLPIPYPTVPVKAEPVLQETAPSMFPDTGAHVHQRTPEQETQARRRWKRKVILVEKRKFRKLMDDLSYRKPTPKKGRSPNKKAIVPRPAKHGAPTKRNRGRPRKYPKNSAPTSATKKSSEQKSAKTKGASGNVPIGKPDSPDSTDPLASYPQVTKTQLLKGRGSAVENPTNVKEISEKPVSKNVSMKRKLSKDTKAAEAKSKTLKSQVRNSKTFAKSTTPNSVSAAGQDLNPKASSVKRNSENEVLVNAPKTSKNKPRAIKKTLKGKGNSKKPQASHDVSMKRKLNEDPKAVEIKSKTRKKNVQNLKRTAPNSGGAPEQDLTPNGSLAQRNSGDEETIGVPELPKSITRAIEKPIHPSKVKQSSENTPLKKRAFMKRDLSQDSNVAEVKSQTPKPSVPSSKNTVSAPGKESDTNGSLPNRNSEKKKTFKARKMPNNKTQCEKNTVQTLHVSSSPLTIPTANVLLASAPTKACEEETTAKTPSLQKPSVISSSDSPVNVGKSSFVQPAKEHLAKPATKKAPVRKPRAKKSKAGSSAAAKPKPAKKATTHKKLKPKRTIQKAIAPNVASKDVKSINPVTPVTLKQVSTSKPGKEGSPSDEVEGTAVSETIHAIPFSSKNSAVNSSPQQALNLKATAHGAGAHSAPALPNSIHSVKETPKEEPKPRQELDPAVGDSVTAPCINPTAKPPVAKVAAVETADEERNASVAPDGGAPINGTIDVSASVIACPVDDWASTQPEDVPSKPSIQSPVLADFETSAKAAKKKIVELEREVAALKWALVRSNAGDEGDPDVGIARMRPEDLGANFANESIETATIAKAWSKTGGTFPPWEIRSNMSWSAQTRSQLCLESVYHHVDDCIRSGSAPPCTLSLRELVSGIISILRMSTKADFANTPLHATVSYAMSKMTEAFLSKIFSSLLMSPSKVDMSWCRMAVMHIIEPILLFSRSESRVIHCGVSKRCASAICDSANSLSAASPLLPHVQVEQTMRAIELAMVIVGTKERSILSQVPKTTANMIGARNFLFLIRLAAAEAQETS